MRILASVVVGLGLVCAACAGVPGPSPAAQRARPDRAPGPPRVVQLAAGRDFTCALSSRGTVRCWGIWTTKGVDPWGRASVIRTPERVSGLDDAVQIAAAGDNACALDAAREVRCWAPSAAASGSPMGVPVRLTGLSSVVEIAVSRLLVCARGERGDARCWALPRGPQADEPWTLAERGALQLVADPAYQIYARLEDGGVVCTGFGGPTPDRAVRALAFDDAQRLSAAGSRVCAWMSDGTPYCFGARGGPDGPVWQTPFTPLLDGSLGSTDDYAWFPDGSLRSRVRDTMEARPGLHHVIQAVEGEHHACALDGAGVVRCWGSADRLGEGGAPPTAPRDVPEARSALSLAARVNLTCAARGAQGVVCWGTGDAWQVASPRPTPFEDAVELGFDAAHVCARARGGAVRCSGFDGGHGRGVRVEGAPLLTRQIVVGQQAAAVLPSGDLAWWRTEPRDGSARDLVARPVRRVHGVAALAFGEARPPYGGSSARGGDWYARLEDGTVLHERCADYPGRGCHPSEALSWGPIQGLTQVVDVAAAADHACAVLETGHVSCWLVEPGHAPTPEEVPGVTTAIRISVGLTHACAIGEQGRVTCWGNNDWGQLGDGGFASRRVARAVPGLDGVVQVALGASHTCARLASGAVQCWGDARRGQTGGGGDPNRQDAPVEVPGLP